MCRPLLVVENGRTRLTKTHLDQMALAVLSLQGKPLNASASSYGCTKSVYLYVYSNSMVYARAQECQPRPTVYHKPGVCVGFATFCRRCEPRCEQGEAIRSLWRDKMAFGSASTRGLFRQYECDVAKLQNQAW